MAADTYLCPTCDSEVKVGGDCPGCAPVRKRRRKKVAAASPKPWEQDEMYDGLGLPDEDFDYDAFIEEECSRQPHRKVGIKLYWWITALVLLVALAWMVFGIL